MQKENDREYDSILRELQDELAEKTPVVDTDGKKVLRLAREFRDQGETIIKLVSSRWYVLKNTNLLDLADDLNRDPNVKAVGIVDDDGSCSGLLYRKDLFDLLSRPFGRDVLRRELVQKVAVEHEPIYLDTSIFSVAERMRSFNHRGEVQYFPLKSANSEFAGLFSSQDLLIYLSEMTQQDITLARAIQTRVVREFFQLEESRFEIVASSTMAKGVGGDFYNLKKYRQDKWFISLCDVSGKGVAASLVTSALWGTIKAFDNQRGVSALIKTLNEFFVTTFQREKYVTGVFLDLNPEDGSMNIADMGHGLAFILRGEKLLRIKSSEQNVPVGVVEDLTPEIFQYNLESGDLVLMLTDGMIEQENRQSEEFGLKRLKDYLIANKNTDLKTLRSGLLERFHQFRKHTPLHDDVTFLLLRYSG